MLARSGELACGEVARLALHSLHLTFDEHSAKSGAERPEEREGRQSLRRVHEHDPVVEEIRIRRRPRPEKAAALRESAHTLNERHASSLSHSCKARYPGRSRHGFGAAEAGLRAGMGLALHWTNQKPVQLRATHL